MKFDVKVKTLAEVRTFVTVDAVTEEEALAIVRAQINEDDEFGDLGKIARYEIVSLDCFEHPLEATEAYPVLS